MMQTTTVTNIEYLDDEEDAYDLSVEEDHSYLLANGIMSHNSTLALQVGAHQASVGARIIYLSLEMQREIVVRRLLSHITGVPLSSINRAHEMDGSAVRQLKRAWMDFHDKVRGQNGRFRIVAPPEDISLEEAVSMFRPHRYNNHIIDYLGLMRGMDDEDQWRKMGAGVRMCTRVASADESIYTILCQLSAEGIIRYSKTIMEHAHLAWTWTYVDEATRDSRIATIRMPKTRNLRGFDMYLRENFARMRFEDLQQSERDQIVEAKRSRRGGKKSMIGHNGGPPLETTPTSIDDDRPRRRPEFKQAAFSL